MNRTNKRTDLWLAIGIFVPICLLLQLAFLFSFTNELSFYFTIWGAIFLAQLITVAVMTCIVLVKKPYYRHIKHWVTALMAMLLTILLAVIIYNIDTPVLYPSQDTPSVTIARLCNDASSSSIQVSPSCFLSLLPASMSGIVQSFGLNTDPYNIPKTQVISFIFCETLSVLFYLVVSKIRRQDDLQTAHEKKELK